MSELDNFQQQNSVRFTDSGLLQQALTHRSYINEHGEAEGHNERLEFLGDAVLDFLVGDILYQRYPDMPEGQLTRLRAALVRTESLAQLAQEMGIGESLRMGKGEEASGGRERITNLCGAFEAVTGALYLDQGLEAVRTFILPRLESLVDEVLEEAIDKDARSRLQEWVQAEMNLTPVYRTVSATGPDHEKEFVVEVLVGNKVVGRGTGRSKQISAQSAARDALRLVEKGELTV